jgi:hypothetical protein
MKVHEEREQLVRARFPREGGEIFGAAPYRTHSVIVQVVFFILTCIGVGATYAFLDVLDFEDSAGVITGIAAIALGEYLIRARRWFGTGVEAALWLGGLVAMISELPSTGAPEALLVLGSAAALAGWRVRNPLFGAVAAMFVAAYAEKRADLGVVCALVLAIVAGLLLLREWKRPTTEWLFIAIVVLLPIYGWFEADERWRMMTIAVYAVFGAVMTTLAFLKRHHALLVSGVVAIIIAAVDWGKLLATPLEAKLALAGAASLGGSFLVSRALRDRVTGVVVKPATLTPVDDLLESVGTVVAAHSARPADTAAGPEARPAGDGRFGGGGASGDY